MGGSADHPSCWVRTGRLYPPQLGSRTGHGANGALRDGEPKSMTHRFLGSD
jgi:hypothetical protein